MITATLIDLSSSNMSLDEMLEKNVTANIWRHAESDNGEFHWAYLYDDDGTCIDVKKVREKKAWQNLPAERRAEYNNQKTEYLLDTLEEYIDETWQLAVDQSIAWCCENKAVFTIDDVWDQIEPGYQHVENPYMIGPILKRYARRSDRTFTGRFITFRTSLANHGTPARVWTGDPEFSMDDLKIYRASKKKKSAQHERP